ncbi:hypothetical protein OAE48_03535 [Flavobacteriales bacterium]|nr:hypothetical protein [Flavobacteriales bacterium]
MKKFLPFILTIAFAIPAFAQETTSEPKEEPKKEKKKIEAKAGKKAKTKVPYRFMGNFHGGVGLMNYFGDLRDKTSTTVHRLGSRAGYNFGIGGNITNWLDVNVNVIMGSIAWNQNQANHDLPQNFEAKVFTAGLNFVYNFKNFIRDSKGITPFISLGVSYSDFKVYTDLQTTTSDGNTYDYYYYSDGTIRSIDESSPQTDGRRILERDHEYESQFTNSPVKAVSIPLGGGIDFNANRHVAVRLAAHYYFTTTDAMDGNNSSDVFATRKKEDTGNPLVDKDGFLYTSLSLIFRFDPFKKKAPEVDVPGAEYVGLSEIIEEDSDGDGVSDFKDRCEGTPKGLTVDDNGCPADDDKDGIPDYRDKEPKTTAGRIVDSDGVAISYQDIYKSYGSDTVSLKRSSVSQDWLFSQKKNGDSKYTVHVGTYTNYDIPTQIKMRLAKMEALEEYKVNDSISVFTLGQFSTFEAAEKRQNELIESGIDEAFGVNQDAIPDVGIDLGVVGFDVAQKQPKGVSLDFEDVDVLQYGVEIKEYRLRIELDKLSKLIAQHGVEMKTTDGGLKMYTIGAFETLAEAEALKKQVIGLGVKNPEVTAKLNNTTITVEEALKQQVKMQGEKSE